MKRSYNNLFWGLLLIGVGVGFLLQQAGVLAFGDIISKFWPLILVVIGLFNLIAGNLFSALAWLTFGGLLQLSTLDVLKGGVGQAFWPALLLIIGLRFLLRPAVKNPKEEKDYIGSTAVFSGNEKVVSSQNFKGSAVNAVFGGASLDLREVKISDEGAVVDVMSLFGGVEIIVSNEVNVRMDVFALFGGSEDTRKNVTHHEGRPYLTVRGTAIFGGVEVTSRGLKK